MNEKRWWNSSANPEKISLTIKSLVVFVPSVVVLLNLFGFHATTEDLSVVITQIAVLISGISLIFGLIRKIYYSRK